MPKLLKKKNNFLLLVNIAINYYLSTRANTNESDLFSLKKNLISNLQNKREFFWIELNLRHDSSFQLLDQNVLKSIEDMINKFEPTPLKKGVHADNLRIFGKVISNWVSSRTKMSKFKKLSSEQLINWRDQHIDAFIKNTFTYDIFPESIQFIFELYPTREQRNILATRVINILHFSRPFKKLIAERKAVEKKDAGLEVTAQTKKLAQIQPQTKTTAIPTSSNLLPNSIFTRTTASNQPAHILQPIESEAKQENNSTVSLTSYLVFNDQSTSMEDEFFSSTLSY